MELILVSNSHIFIQLKLKCLRRLLKAMAYMAVQFTEYSSVTTVIFKRAIKIM